MRKWVGLIIQKYFYGCTIGCDICIVAAALLSLFYRDDYVVVGLSVGLTIMGMIGHIISLFFVYLGARMVMKVSGIFKPRLNYSRFFEDWPDQDTNKFLLYNSWIEYSLYNQYYLLKLLLENSLHLTEVK